MESRIRPISERLASLYVVQWDGGADFVCRDCAIDFAKENKLEWNNPNHYNFTEENENGWYTYEDVFSQVECDYPTACDCGKWLDVSLTPDGINYIRENLDTMPQEVIDYYHVTKEEN